VGLRVAHESKSSAFEALWTAITSAINVSRCRHLDLDIRSQASLLRTKAVYQDLTISHGVLVVYFKGTWMKQHFWCHDAHKHLQLVVSSFSHTCWSMFIVTRFRQHIQSSFRTQKSLYLRLRSDYGRLPPSCRICRYQKTDLNVLMCSKYGSTTMDSSLPFSAPKE
jgi:hypothetical protein